VLLILLNSGSWGGVDVLTMRFAEYLRGRGLEFAICDSAGSRMRSDLPWARFVDPHSTSTLSGRIDRILLPSVSKLGVIPALADRFGEVPLLTWVVHPNEPLTNFVPMANYLLSRFGYRVVQPLLAAMPTHRRMVNELFVKLIEGRSLVVMDGATRRALSYFYPGVGAECLPTIPIPAPLSDAAVVKGPPREPLSIGYLGRLDGFKWSALGPFVRHELALLATYRPVRLVAVTEGEGIANLERACRTAWIELELHNFMPNDAARQLIAERTHLAVAMGTAALDLAGTGHPCLVIDPAAAKGAAPQRKFGFIHEAQDHCLGEYRDMPGYKEGPRSLSNAIALVEREDLAKEARRYIAINHDPDTVFGEIIGALDGCRTTVADVAPTLRSLDRSMKQKNRYYRWLRL
jgi:hypothetical protein